MFLAQTQKEVSSAHSCLAFPRGSACGYSAVLFEYQPLARKLSRRARECKLKIFQVPDLLACQQQHLIETNQPIAEDSIFSLTRVKLWTLCSGYNNVETWNQCCKHYYIGEFRVADISLGSSTNYATDH